MLIENLEARPSCIQYGKASVCDFPVTATLLVIEWLVVLIVVTSQFWATCSNV